MRPHAPPARTASWRLFAAGAACFVAAGAALISAGEWLGRASPLFGIPWGNLVAAAMIASPSLAVLAVIRSVPLLWAARLAAGMAATWLPVSMAMAGNVYLNDFGALYDAFRAYSVACVGLPLLLLVAWLVHSRVAKRT